jgi:sugar/nucleoside kinase (ribokinase family)
MAHAQGLPLAKAMLWANAAAALSCTRVGARAGMPHAPALAAAMAD